MRLTLALTSCEVHECIGKEERLPSFSRLWRYIEARVDVLFIEL
jgi:hypothetical protein